MKIGHMNSPFFPLEEEFNFTQQEGFDFLELTIEPPSTPLHEIDPDRINLMKEKYNLPIPMVHNSWYIPYANPLDEVRNSCLPYLEGCLEVSQAVGASWMNIHTNLSYSGKLIGQVIENHLDFLRRLTNLADGSGVGVMLEPVGSRHDTFETLSRILEETPKLGFHLDLGHAHITEPDSGEKLIRKFIRRLRHVHVSDNRGQDDEHLPLGCGDLPLEKLLGVLAEEGYDGTFTLEIFSRDRGYLLKSRDTFISAWEGVS